MKHIVVGTSGHVDHGKSTLVQSLTGIDPDRFQEEKERGITIDLGFAHYIWQESLEVSFVDVPGHENFVHNMLAGIGGIQLLILVVAADGGVMPQTREHLHICNLLGIKQGLTVITRVDLADEEMIELVQEEVYELIEGTFLEEQPILQVSAITQQGLEGLRQEIARQADKLPATAQGGSFRLPVDRSFSVKGFGTVVTGTALEGKTSLDQELLLYPQEQPLKIRGFQVHQKPAQEIVPGQRAAINLSGIHKDEIQRGNQIAVAGKLINTRVLDVELQLIPGQRGIKKSRCTLKFFSHAQEVGGKLVTTSDFDFLSEAPQVAQLRLDDVISCCFGDRFILRSPSPLETVAGGRIIAPLGNRVRKNRERLQESWRGLSSDASEVRIKEAVFLAGTQGVEAKQLAVLVGIGQKVITKEVQKLAAKGEIIQINPTRKRFLHHRHCLRIGVFFVRSLKAFHKKNPEKSGARSTDFYGKMSRLYEAQEIAVLLNWVVKQKLVVKENEYYRLPDFEGGLTAQQEEMKETILDYLLQQGVQPPGIVNMSTALNLPPKSLEKILKIGHREKWIIRVKEDLWYREDILVQVKTKLLEWFQGQESLTVIEFKDLLGVSRKHAIGLLEYFDSIHLTRRVDNHRILRLDHSASF